MIRLNGRGAATHKRRLAGSAFAASLAGLVFAGLSMQSAAAAETRSYVVSWFHIANFLGGPEDCPNGLNPMSTEFYRTDLIALGKTPAEADELLKNFPGGPGGPDGAYIKLIMNRGDHGKTNAFAHPETVEDPHLKTVEGHFAYGFNLDGKGTASPNSFEDPETHEKGVNNQYWRAVGCVRSFRAAEPTRPTYAAANWDILRDQMPAWLISISGITDPRNSDNVTVTFDRALEHITRDANGDVRSDMTYRVDPNPRSHNVLHGKIKDGVLTIEPGDLHMTADPFLQPDYNFHQTHLRLELKPDGGLKGILGAYHDWYPIYWSYAAAGWIVEHSTSLELPGLYYALKRLADASPDPKTGENTAISTAFRIEAVPAFLVQPDDTTDRKTADAR